MKRIFTLLSLFFFFATTYASIGDIVTNDTIINTCDSATVYYGPPSGTFDSLSYEFTGALTLTGDSTGSGTKFPQDTTFVLIIEWDTVGVATSIDSIDFWILVRDTALPNLTSVDTTVYLDANGKAGIDTSFVLTSVSDNCELDSVWMSVDTFVCGSLGDSTVWIYASDTTGNIDSVSALVHVLDTISPTITVSDTAVYYLDSMGNSPVSAGDLTTIALDNCTIDSTWLGTDSILCPTDTLASSWLFTVDLSGNKDSVMAYAIVRDTIYPIARAHDTTVYLDSAGNFQLTAAHLDSSSWDNDCLAVDSLWVSDTFFTCSNIGDTTVTLFVLDKWGLKDSTTATITIADSLAPIIVPVDTAIAYLNDTGRVVIDTSYVLESIYDNCGIDSVWIIDSIFTCDSIGYNDVWIYAEDIHGNRDSVISVLNVKDSLPPTIACQFNIYVVVDPASCDTVLTIQAPASTDGNCAGSTMSYILSGATIDTSAADVSSVTDTFGIGLTYITWTATDNDGNTASCIQEVSTYSSLIAVDDSVGTAEDTVLVFNPLGNDTDCDQDIDPTSMTIIDSANHGSTTIDLLTGEITYTPDTDFNGFDTLQYKVKDDRDFTDSAMVVITVTPVNDPPVVDNDSITTIEDTPYTGDLTDAGDYDPDGTGLIVTTAPVVSPAHGTILIAGDGVYTYTPGLNYNGSDLVVISVCDSGAPGSQCANDTLFITITPANDAPITFNDSISMDEDYNFVGDFTDGRAYDPDGTQLSVVTIPVSGPSHGTIFINASGAYTYTPTANFNGNDRVIVAICDQDQPSSSCSNDTLFITVNPVNDAPVLFNEAVTIPEDGTITTGHIINTNDVDPDGTVLTANTTPLVGPSHGSITILPNGNFTYTPVANYNGTDLVVVSVCDAGTPGTLCGSDSVKITVTPVNDDPYVDDAIDDVTIVVNGNSIIGLDGVFSDPDVGDELAYSATLQDGSALPSWITFDVSTQTFLVLSPTGISSLGTVTVKVMATDLAGRSAIDQFDVTVVQDYSIGGVVRTNEGEVDKSALIEQASGVGVPAPNVDMVLKEGSTTVQTVQTDVNGEYRFIGLAAKTYEVVVDLPYYTQDTTYFVILSEDNPIMDSFNFTIWTNHSLITDVEDIGNSFETKLYPNPTNGIVNISIEKAGFEMADVSVYSVVGEMIFSKKYAKNETIQFDMSGQVSGMYFVKLNIGGSLVVKKLILDRK